MKIHLIRHAEPELFSKSGKDFDRTLSPNGQLEAQRLARHLTQHVQQCETWCSSSVRTTETAGFLKQHDVLGTVSFFADFHLAPRNLLLERIWESKSHEDLLLVGHNFGLSELLHYLTGEDIMLQTAEFVSIDFPNLARHEVSRETGVIVHRFHPSTDSSSS